MKINEQLVYQLRMKRSWTQEELAIAAGLNLKTVQRIEKGASASLQSKKALASAFEIDVHDLNYEEKAMKPCPECGSENVYKYKKTIGTNPECLPDMLPKLGSGITFRADFVPVVCGDCGYIRYFANDKEREKLANSKHWELL